MKLLNPTEERLRYPIWQIIKDIWKLSGSARPQLVLGTILRILGDLAGLYPAVVLGWIVNEAAKGTAASFSHLWFWVATWIAAALFRYITQHSAKRMIYLLGEKLVFDTERKMLGIMFSKDSAWHENETSGTKIKRIEKGAVGYKDIVRAWVNAYIEIIIRFIGMPLILFKFDHAIAILMGFFMISYFAMSKYMQKRCVVAAHNFNVADEQVGGILVESVGNIRTVRLLHVGQSMLEKIEKHIKVAFEAARERIAAFQLQSHICASYARVFNICVVAFIAFQVIHGRYEVGMIIMFSTYFFDIWTNLNELTNMTQDTIVSQQSIARMYHLIGREIPPETGTQKFPVVWDAINVEKLSFSYGNNEALSNLTFTIKKGEKVGIVGLSGAGKSTLFKLLLKERADYHGRIAIGDIEVRDIKESEYYKHVSIVPQDTEVFNFSLKENISIVNAHKHEAGLFEKSMEVSHVKDFIHKLPEGVDTLIGERGIKLSGGERQRLGIARAIYKQPDILLLDEATSHLDLESEEKIKDSLHKFFEGITALVIAHRLTTIKEMDKIIVIEKGKIIEQGSFDELYKKKGRFHELWEKQKFD